MWKWSAPSIDEAIVYWKYGTKNEIVTTLISPRTTDLRVIKLVVCASGLFIQKGVQRDDLCKPGIKQDFNGAIQL